MKTAVPRLGILAFACLVFALAPAEARDLRLTAGRTHTLRETFTHNGAPIHVPRGATLHVLGSARGAGAYTGGGTVVYEGAFSPGNSPALVTYSGDVVFGTFSSLTMELAGTARGTGYDAINVAGKLTFGGTLNVVLLHAFTPVQGDTFNLFDWGTTAGSFSTVNLPPLAPFLAWDTSQLYVTGIIRVVSTLTPIEQWRLLHFGFHTNTGLAANTADPDGDGSVNLIEYGLLLDPLVPATTSLPAVGRAAVGANEHLTITFTRPLSATDLRYLVEVTADFAPWLPGSSYTSSGDVPSNAHTTQVSRTTNGAVETITVRDNTPIGAVSQRFLRVQVSLP